ncbi:MULTISPECIES: circularly permuted type 2 ATP-grasp protein [unclassified Modestobacter]|uniref:circularly permuted type 2 ATP-grasp protein n=1 Tax=unclassified Modestobacter TaxID=2643866 RepID=UPI0022A9FBF4|nr:MULTISPECIES: circularly permuted type 2 ATP-grasp protein [unclassified Modestobacter]MCZ2825254.1 circularly permuted type 2 ATP-grasp protein [Modestobacter sp. VKM Ac-2981]MCZ2853681.1 circularly permuted type 2 ATP-grasp protein [Modestobacter sp. VKM Ac-2982]
MTDASGVFAPYPGSARDEAVGAAGSLRPAYRPVLQVLDELGPGGIGALVDAVAGERRDRGVVVGGHVDGRLQERPLPLCPVPRLLSAADWSSVARGAEQRHRALNAFLADVYRPAGRRRTDADRHAEVVRAGVVPAWVVAASPGLRASAAGLAVPGQPRVAVSGLDLRHGPAGWVAVADDLSTPSGLGHAISDRVSSRAALPELHAAAEAAGLTDPGEAVPLLRAALAEAAPPACTGSPQLAVLSEGPHSSSWFEHRLLAAAMDVPIATPDTLWPARGGGVAVQVDGQRLRVDVLHRQLDEAGLAAHLTPSGAALDVLLGAAVRAGELALANVPGNGVADGEATYRYVPELIRFYLGEEPVLDTVRTWLLADEADLAEVRDRLHELVVRPVDGYGGSGVVVGPRCSAAELAELQAEVAATPHRFIAQEPVDGSTVPTVVGGALVPRAAGLRVFTVAGATTTRALPAPWTRMALADGSAVLDGSSKDTWLLP